MESLIFELEESIEYCLIPKLARNFEDSEYHAEFDKRDARLDKKCQLIINKILEINFRLKDTTALASLFILHLELLAPGPWHTQKCKEFSTLIECWFDLTCEVSLKNILRCDGLDRQTVFDNSLEKLHQKLTPVDFKKYPSLVEVYCTLIADVHIQGYKVKLYSKRVLPISLLLIDDYLITNKIKGVKCCRYILLYLDPEDFINGNYYEVLYGSLKKAFYEKDLEITKLVCHCFQLMLRILPTKDKVNKTDRVYSDILDQLGTESNLQRKESLFIFFRDLIRIHGVDGVKRKKTFIAVICYNIDESCNEAVEKVLLTSVLECLTEWIRFSWCAWQVAGDQKLLSVLFKLLYICNEEYVNSVIILTVTLISLCSAEEQNQIVNSLENSSRIKSHQFQQRINLIKKRIPVR